MTSSSHHIEGGDFAGAGGASRGLKEQLQRIGAQPEIVRRAMIAAYEAEMNVVIHAERGTLWARINDGRLDLEVVDEGPGIPDVELAMKPGYSTAGPVAKALGFGAGLGLPNIRRSSDRFSIDTRLGEGTRVRSTIFLRAEAAADGAGTSVQAVPELCRGCLSCLKACPTAAVRVRERRPEILAAQCVGCTECIAACPDGALILHGPGDSPGQAAAEPGEGSAPAATAVLPLAFLTGFGAAVSPLRVLGALGAAGFRSVRFVEEWEAPLREATLRWAAARPAEQLPVISPLCPAVLELIAVSFPSLLPQVAPFLTPVEAVCLAFRLEALAVVPACPAQQGLLEADSLAGRLQILSPDALRARLRPSLTGSGAPAGPPTLRWQESGSARGGSGETVGASASEPRVLRVEGVRHAQRVLEAVEKGLLGGVGVLELLACTGGCFGSPLFPEDPYVARARHPFLDGSGATATPAAEAAHAPALPDAGGGSHAHAFPRPDALRPRRGVRLDPDMVRAIEKLSRIDALTRSLPGRDCAACGSPSCAALAEDVVLGRAAREACVFDRGPGESKEVPS